MYLGITSVSIKQDDKGQTLVSLVIPSESYKAFRDSMAKEETCDVAMGELLKASIAAKVDAVADVQEVLKQQDP